MEPRLAAEERQAGLEAVDLGARAVPVGTLEAHGRLMPAVREGRLARDFVAELLRDASGPDIAVDETRNGRLCAEPVEGKRQDRGAHLRAETVPLVPLTEPRAALELAPRRKVARVDVLRTDDPALREDTELEIPRIRTPGATQAE